MAALDADKRTEDIVSARRVVIADLPAVSDGDTFKAHLSEGVRHATVVPIGADAVAADSIAVASISGDTVTFQVAGTARTATVTCYGNGPQDR